MDLFLVVSELVGLSLELGELLVQLDALGGGSVGNTAFQFVDSGAVTGLQLMDVVRADAGDGVRLVAVHVDQALEAVLLAAVEEPVDRSLLVDLQMVRIEIVEEVVSDDLAGRALAAQCVGDIFQILKQGGWIPRIRRLNTAILTITASSQLQAHWQSRMLIGWAVNFGVL